MSKKSKKMQQLKPCFNQSMNVKHFKTPEDGYLNNSVDFHLSKIWLQVYVEMIKNKPRVEARMIADEALEDYMETFNG